LPREHDTRRTNACAVRIGRRAPRIDAAADRNVVSARFDAAARDNLTGKDEGTINGEMSTDEEDTLPHPSVDREVAIADDDWRTPT